MKENFVDLGQIINDNESDDENATQSNMINNIIRTKSSRKSKNKERQSLKEIDDRTSTIIGTSHYMAPEISRGEGYSFEVDIWSLAICMYEFLCGGLPFNSFR